MDLSTNSPEIFLVSLFFFPKVDWPLLRTFLVAQMMGVFRGDADKVRRLEDFFFFVIPIPLAHLPDGSVGLLIPQSGHTIFSARRR